MHIPFEVGPKESYSTRNKQVSKFDEGHKFF